jgi:hypothetical protein
MHKHTPQNTECFNWHFWREVFYVQTISGVHEHLYLRAITKTQVSERRHMASSDSQVPENIGIPSSTWSMGDCTSVDYCCHLTHFCVPRTSLYNFEKDLISFGDFTLQNVECYSGKHKKFSSKSLIMLRDLKCICTSTTLPSRAQVSESFADILQA